MDTTVAPGLAESLERFDTKTAFAGP